VSVAQGTKVPTRQAAWRRGGFTLIELMIAVAIVALLATVAYGSFTGAALKGKRAEGRAALLDLIQQQERYLTQTGSYLTFAAGATGANGASDAATGVNIPFRTFSGDVPGKGAYTVGAELCDGTPVPSRRECVRLFAVPNVADAEGGNLRYTSTGIKDCTGTKTSVCWR
jgi:type IV pilus assembly protein PilE